MVYQKREYTPEFREEFAARCKQAGATTFGELARITRQLEYDYMLRDPEIIGQMAVYGLFRNEADSLGASIPEQRGDSEQAQARQSA